MCATLGVAMDNHIRKSQLADMAKAVVLDSFGSVAIEQVCTQVDEIIAEKERLLNQYVFFKEEDLYIAENNLEKNSPEEAAKELDRAKENYKKAVDVQKQYEAKEITIDDALEKLNIPPSKMLQKYYEQNEVVE